MKGHQKEGLEGGEDGGGDGCQWKGGGQGEDGLCLNRSSYWKLSVMV